MLVLLGDEAQLLECVPRCPRPWIPPLSLQKLGLLTQILSQHLKSGTSLGYKTSCLTKNVILIENLQIQKDLLRDQHHGVGEERQGRCARIKVLILRVITA